MRPPVARPEPAHRNTAQLKSEAQIDESALPYKVTALLNTCKYYITKHARLRMAFLAGCEPFLDVFIIEKQFMSKHKGPILTSIPVILRRPTDRDGHAVNRLVERCKPLDTNSVYCNLLQCSDFADTAIAAENEAGELVGFISGYRPPSRLETLFVWQVAVDSSMRGQGLALRMLMALIERVAGQGVRYLETTISPGNTASEALFAKAFKALGVEPETRVLFDRAIHFNGQHDDEMLYRAGPFSVVTAKQNQETA